MSIATLVKQAQDQQEEIRRLSYDLRETKGALFAELLEQMGPLNAVASGAVTVNLRRIAQLFR